MLAKCFSHLWDIIACWWRKGKGWRQKGQSCLIDLYADIGNNECHKFLSKCLLFLTNQVLELVWRVFSQGMRYLVLLICYSIHLGTTVGQETKTTLMFLPKTIMFGFFSIYGPSRTFWDIGDTSELSAININSTDFAGGGGGGMVV